MSRGRGPIPHLEQVPARARARRVPLHRFGSLARPPRGPPGPGARRARSGRPRAGGRRPAAASARRGPSHRWRLVGRRPPRGTRQQRARRRARPSGARARRGHRAGAPQRVRTARPGSSEALRRPRAGRASPPRAAPGAIAATGLRSWKPWPRSQRRVSAEEAGGFDEAGYLRRQGIHVVLRAERLPGRRPPRWAREPSPTGSGEA